MDKKIVMFTLPRCGYCESLKKTLAAHGIEFEISQDFEEMERLGIQNVPQLLVDGRLYNYIEATNLIQELQEN